MKQDLLKFIIQRYDSYYNAANTKGSFLLGFNTFLSGAIFASYKGLMTMVGPNNLCLFNTLIVILLILCAFSIFLICMAIIPYLKSGNSPKTKYHSLLFFGSVSDYNEDEYCAAIKNSSDSDLEDDMCKQACVLAHGLRKKYNLLFFAGWIIPIEIIILLTLILLIII
ncbi:MAG: DUF5706 domain-containing protein [Bacteroidales bacterium]|nr:DUF5706 domain-containing protein [Bacteroidales bacterium]